MTQQADSTQLATIDAGGRALTKDERSAVIDGLESQVLMIREAMQRVLEKGRHYGTIPGTQKPSLWQPGAEMLCQMFQFQTDITRTSEYEDWEKGIFAYTYKCRLMNRHGELITEREATCSTEETKYKKSRQPAAEQRETIMQMAQKRAYVSAVKGSAAASAIFSQDDDIVSDQGSDQGHGTCPEHGVAWFQKGRMKSPAHPIDGGGWCNKPDSAMEPDQQAAYQERKRADAACHAINWTTAAFIEAQFPELKEKGSANLTAADWADVADLAQDWAKDQVAELTQAGTAGDPGDQTLPW